MHLYVWVSQQQKKNLFIKISQCVQFYKSLCHFLNLKMQIFVCWHSRSTLKVSTYDIWLMTLIYHG